ncbi:RHS repeat-associated core domain-containing protein [Streptomyces sp. H10-C2]|uniref:RHS repeat domain-containing protein n=1 Tax=unclassified Streptomyces TaxID=2593676 RepID=UPI0024BA3EBD|nr:MULTISPECIES: RHS repeat-associated core domain-containing protein [unclassified Streptomyces]MDJ0347569.1 RHS repeat-associated core domain-containing protein [Streptomyces sp. PH10-H1]MDJ0375750.1 RHS repeat-associated core domain-containing protein [Streptomyces sp. H10-C2]
MTDSRGITLHTDYDVLGRKTALKQGATPLAGWTYDTATGGLGQPATSTRYVNGEAYTTAVTYYTALNKPGITQVTIPAGAGALGGTYKWTTGYYPTGEVKSVSQPALGDLPQEVLTPLYTVNSALPATLAAGTDPIVSNTVYDHYGRTTREEFGAFGSKVFASYEYDEHTSALTRQITDRDIAPQRVNDTRYVYDPAGNVTSTATTSGQDAAAVTDTQCFVTDALRRITDAWTATDQCATTPAAGSSSTVGGPDAYWTSYGYDPVGNRTTETQHQTATGPATDTTRTYQVPATGKHNLPGVTVNGTSAETYTYDVAGNTVTRKVGAAAQQDLTWDLEGHLTKLTQGPAITNYTYDADGQRLLRKDSTGTTLYLPGGNELLLKPDNTTKTATRYYTYGDKTVAMRTASKLIFLISDQHGTATTQIDATTQAVTRRKTTIFGGARGTASTGWSGDNGFVGGTKDTDTGLTHLGAREYDPTIGRFLSVDPLLEFDQPQTLGGYAYADSNPATYSDPTGRTKCDINPELCNKTTSPIVENDNAAGKCGKACIPSGDLEYGDTEDRQYNKEAPSRRDKKVYGKVGWVLTGSWAKDWTNAHDLLQHWMENSGDDYEVDPSTMINEIPNFKKTVASYLAGVSKSRNHIFDSGWQGTRSVESDGGKSLDWFYALNHFQWRVSGTKLTREGIVYNLEVRKRYDWGVPSEHRDDLNGAWIHFNQPELAHLHTVGMARDFNVYGSSPMRGILQ